MILAIISISVAALLSVIFFIVDYKTNGKYSLITKTLASFGFVTAGVLASINLIDNFTGFSLILIGLICGMLGDIFLALRKTNSEDNSYLIAGIGSFALGHGLYIAGITVVACAYVNVIIPLVVALGSTPLLVITSLLVFKKMKVDFSKFQLPVILYTFILVFATAFTIGLGVLYPAIFLFAGGLLSILVSDIILSFVLFKSNNNENKKGKEVEISKNNKIKELLLHIIYYAGQILIVSFIFFFFYF